jgi:hypothetical protein
MIRTTPQRRFHVSNRLALMAALVLAVASFYGASQAPDGNSGYEQTTVAANTPADHQATSGTGTRRKLSIGLLLFGRG